MKSFKYIREANKIKSGTKVRARNTKGEMIYGKIIKTGNKTFIVKWSSLDPDFAGRTEHPNDHLRAITLRDKNAEYEVRAKA